MAETTLESLNSGRYPSTTTSLTLADYNPLHHLNAIFSTQTALSAAPQTAAALAAYEAHLDADIDARTREQSQTNAQSVERIAVAQRDLAALFLRIDAVQERARQTEETITSMTAEIKRLDETKKNLTMSMTALKRLQMLTTAYEQLQVLVQTRQYAECASLLQAVMQLMQHFKSYRSIDQLAQLSRDVSDLQRELLEQICEDFEVAFSKNEILSKQSMLAEACLVLDALGDNARARLTTWYCNTRLREYRHLFRSGEESAALENVGMRFSWFKRLLKAYDHEHAMLFPPAWRVGELLADAFCITTRDELRVDGSDVDLLLRSLQETLEFEQFLDKKLTATSRSSLDTNVSSDEPFAHVISAAFEPHLGAWVAAQDRHLAEMLPKYRQEPLRPAGEPFHAEAVSSSSTDLFSFYRLALSQCTRLSPGPQLVSLGRVFARYLDQYSQQVLWHHLDNASLEDLIVVLNTADYCYTTSTQLEERIKARVTPAELRDDVDLQSQGEAFMGIAASTIRELVRRVEASLESGFREMRTLAWNKLENVGDSSSYAAMLVTQLEERARETLLLLHKTQYARAFADNNVELVTNAIIANIFQCKPVSEVGAEQMLLDAYAIRRSLEALPALKHDAKIPSGYTKHVAQATGRIDRILKTIQVRSAPAEALVQAYLIHIGDKSDTNFRRILDLKGLKRQEQSQLVDLFHAHRSSPKHESLPASSPIMASLDMSAATSQNGVGAALSTATGLGSSNLPLRFGPSGFGSAIMTAARDGVDRLGHPTVRNDSLDESASPDLRSQVRRTLSPPPANLNDNLRNIGRFFKRDAGSFGSLTRRD